MKIPVKIAVQHKALRDTRNYCLAAMLAAFFVGARFCQWRQNTGFWNNFWMMLSFAGLVTVALGAVAFFRDLKKTLGQYLDFDPETGNLAFVDPPPDSADEEDEK